MRLSDCLGEPVLAADGTSLGRLHDLAADPTVAAPVVTAIEIRRRRHSQLVPWEAVAVFDPDTVQLRDGGATPGRELAPSELLLRRDVLDGQVVDVAGRRLLRVGDVELSCAGSVPAVVAVEVGTRAVLRRLGLRRLSRRFRPESVTWDELHLAGGRGHEIQLRSGRLERLGPAALAQVIGRVAPAPALQIVRAVPPDVAARSVASSHPRLGGRIRAGSKHRGPRGCSSGCPRTTPPQRFATWSRSDWTRSLLRSRRATRAGCGASSRSPPTRPEA